MPRLTATIAITQALFLELAALLVTHHLGRFLITTFFHVLDDSITEGKEEASQLSDWGYFVNLPKDSVPVLLVLVVDYWWQLGIERALPARPRPAPFMESGGGGGVSEKKGLKDLGMNGGGGSVRSEKGGMGEMVVEDDAAEQRIISKLIAEGKVQRPSISWFNTIVKWCLDMSVGNLWRSAVVVVVSLVVNRVGWGKCWGEFKSGLFVSMLEAIVSPIPFFTFIGLLAVPAYKRIVFLSGINLIFHVFVYFFVVVMIPFSKRIGFFDQIVASMNASNVASASAAVNATGRVEL